MGKKERLDAAMGSGPSGGTGSPAEAQERDEEAQSLTYKEAGVDVDKAARLVGDIGAHVARTRRPGVLGGIGGFGGLFALDKERYEEPVLVSGADGVGTKLQLAFALDKHNTIGQDCVAMCVNDIVVQGAEPLFFLDYIGTGRLQSGVVEQIVAGVADGCELAGCALLGGETAEMPGSYPEGEYDIAGFAVGVVEKADIVDGASVQPGDAIVGFASNGVHSNGYSLVRRILARAGSPTSRGSAAGSPETGAGGGAGATAGVADPDAGPDAPLPAAGLDPTGSGRLPLEQKPAELGGLTLGEELLKPTRIYVKSVLALLELGFDIRAMAHITGGGLTENIPRTLPDGLGARLAPAAWPRQGVFDWLRKHGPVEDDEMRRTFNDGIGFVLIVPDVEADAFVAAATELGEEAFVIGEVMKIDEVAETGGQGEAERGRVMYT